MYCDTMWYYAIHAIGFAVVAYILQGVLSTASSTLGNILGVVVFGYIVVAILRTLVWKWFTDCMKTPLAAWRTLLTSLHHGCALFQTSVAGLLDVGNHTVCSDLFDGVLRMGSAVASGMYGTLCGSASTLAKAFAKTNSTNTNIMNTTSLNAMEADRAAAMKVAASVAFAAVGAAESAARATARIRADAAKVASGNAANVAFVAGEAAMAAAKNAWSTAAVLRTDVANATAVNIIECAVAATVSAANMAAEAVTQCVDFQRMVAECTERYGVDNTKRLRWLGEYDALKLVLVQHDTYLAPNQPIVQKE